MSIIQNYINIKNEIKSLSQNAKLIVVSKGQDVEKIKPLLECGQVHFGENKVQETIQKWPSLIRSYANVKGHIDFLLLDYYTNKEFNKDKRP